MKITELLERAGDGLKHQRLDGSFVSMRQKKAHAEITFSTEPAVASQLAKSVMTGKAPRLRGNRGLGASNRIQSLTSRMRHGAE